MLLVVKHTPYFVHLYCDLQMTCFAGWKRMQPCSPLVAWEWSRWLRKSLTATASACSPVRPRAGPRRSREGCACGRQCCTYQSRATRAATFLRTGEAYVVFERHSRGYKTVWHSRVAHAAPGTHHPANSVASCPVLNRFRVLPCSFLYTVTFEFNVATPCAVQHPVCFASRGRAGAALAVDARPLPADALGAAQVAALGDPRREGDRRERGPGRGGRGGVPPAQARCVHCIGLFWLSLLPWLVRWARLTICCLCRPWVGGQAGCIRHAGAYIVVMARAGEPDFVYQSCTHQREREGSMEGDFCFVEGTIARPGGADFTVMVRTCMDVGHLLSHRCPLSCPFFTNCQTLDLSSAMCFPQCAPFPLCVPDIVF